MLPLFCATTGISQKIKYSERNMTHGTSHLLIGWGGGGGGGGGAVIFRGRVKKKYCCVRGVTT